MINIYQHLKRFWLIISIIAMAGFVLIVGDYIPLSFQRLSYTFSFNLKAILMYFLPLLVYPYIVTSIMMIRVNGIILLITLLLLIVFSNFLSILIGAGVAYITLPNLPITLNIVAGTAESLTTVFNINLTPILGIENVLMLGFFTGLILSEYRNTLIINLFKKYKVISNFLLKNIFIPSLPLYILGMIIKIKAENNFKEIFHEFGCIIFSIIFTQFTYILFLFFVGSNFSAKLAFQRWKNCIPAALLGFSTMSSLMSMPITLKAAEKNLGNKDIAQIAITTTVNCHDVGECISLAFLTLAIYFMGNDLSFPQFLTFIHFAFVLAVAQFTGVSVPGGSVVVIVPLLTTYLEFTDEMVGLITTISLFMDPIGTSNNVLGNSAFALIIDKCCSRILYIKQKLYLAKELTSLFNSKRMLVKKSKHG